MMSEKLEKSIDRITQLEILTAKHCLLIDSMKESINLSSSKLEPIHKYYENRKNFRTWMSSNWWKICALIISMMMPLLIAANYIHDKILNLPSPVQIEEIARLKTQLEINSGSKNN